MNNQTLKTLTYDLLQKYYTECNGYNLVKHLLESYNDFVLRKVEHIIKGFNPIVVHHTFMPEHEKFKHILEVEIKNPVLSKPMIYEKDGSTKLMTPMDARNRNFTYSGPITIDIDIRAKTFNTETGDYNIESKTINNVALGKIPIMVLSRYCILSSYGNSEEECRYDYGGYFVVNGNEKVVISQDRIAENKTYVFVNNKVSAFSCIAEIRSVQENKFSVPKTTTLKLSSKPNQFGRYMRINIHHIKNDIPLFILFRALGVESDHDIVDLCTIVGPECDQNAIMEGLVGTIEEANNVLTQRDAMEYLIRYLNINGYPKEVLSNRIKRMEILREVLTHEFLPHVGTDFHKKALYLGYMVNKLLRCHLGLIPYDDRDSYINKRIDTPGIQMANLFRQYYGKVIKDMKNMLQKEINSGGWKATNKLINVINKVNINKVIKSTIIESGLKYGLSTGNWGIKNNKTKQGVAQVLNRLSYNATISHLRRINTPIDKTGKLIQPRKLHGTQMGVICPAETPEGVSVGLVKNLSVSGSITVSSDSTNLRELLASEGGIAYYMGTKRGSLEGSIDIFARPGATRVFVNGDLIGTHINPIELYTKVKLWKKNGVINAMTGVVWNIIRGEIWISTEGGRCVRPLYVVENNKPIMATSVSNAGKRFEELVIDGVIEFLDVEECNNAMIAMKPEDLQKGAKGAQNVIEYTHLEMDPSLLMGVMAGSIPFSNHNQSPRNCYQASMGKQAIGVYTSNFRKRYDTLGHVLNYPQAPLVQTRVSKIVNTHKMPCGINAIVAIATYTGYNQEDSVILNKSAIDRGLYQSTYFRTYKEVLNKNHSTGEEEYFCKPDPANTKQLKPQNYEKLNIDGFVPENTYVQTGDILIGKCMPQKQGADVVNKDTSLSLKNNEHGFVDQNSYGDMHFTNVNGDGYNFAKVRLRNDRIPTIGDKFASRSAQKGSLGMIYQEQDMPFTKDGIRPDIIMNPHAIPSRMTIGQLMECIMGKACVHLGTLGDGTPFSEITVEDIADVLESCGLERYGNEIMYNPRTGEQMATDIFIGPTYYQRLKHMTADKVHSRACNGPVVMLTRQPAEGRARDGGLRLGEMEIECNWAHGIMHFLKERFMECSDNYRVFVCKKCGMMANVNPDKGIYQCKPCKNTISFSEIRIPYACKLLFQEIQTMGIGAKFLT